VVLTSFNFTHKGSSKPMAKSVYLTTGTCAREILLEIDGGLIENVTFVGGCTGNAQGISALVKGRPVAEVISTLKGIRCRNNTSCPDQLALALESVTLQQAS
jgi:uncharacterized protein (TIGR03905 family)